MGNTMNEDYSPRYYKSVNYSLNRKRQIIDAMLEELHELHAQMIEDALARSDFEQANIIINHVRGL